MSLQDKLDQLAHDRDVLWVLRELARHGLREGDVLWHAHRGVAGRLVVRREVDPPGPVVLTEDGTHHAFDARAWSRARPAS